MNPHLTQLTKTFAQIEPQLWQRCFPRLYRETESGESPRLAAFTMFGALAAMRDYPEKCGRIDRDTYFATEFITAAQVPTLFIGKEFLQSVCLTQVPAGLRWDDVKFPFECGLLMLPADCPLKFPDGANAECLGYARISAITPIPRSIKRKPENLLLRENTFMVFTTHPMNGTAFEFTLNASGHPTIDENTLDIKTSVSSEFEIPFTGSDSEFLDNCRKILFGLLLAITARPNLVQTGSRQGFHKKAKCEIWSPNIIKGFRTETKISAHPATAGNNDGDNEKRTSPRPHWRRGHFRSQPVGTNRAEHKIIWVEPFFVGGRAE